MMSNIVLDLIGKKSCNRSFPPTTSSSSERQRNLLLRMHLLRVNTKKTSVLSKILWRRRRAEPFSLPRRPTSHKWRMRWLQRYPLTPRTLTGIHSSSSPRSKDRRYRSHCGIFFLIHTVHVIYRSAMFVSFSECASFCCEEVRILTSRIAWATQCCTSVTSRAIKTWRSI